MYPFRNAPRSGTLNVNVKITFIFTSCKNKLCSSFLFQWRSTHLFAILLMLIIYKDSCLGFHSCQWHLESLIFVENGLPKKHCLYDENIVDSLKKIIYQEIPVDLKNSTINLVWVAHTYKWQYYAHEN